MRVKDLDEDDWIKLCSVLLYLDQNPSLALMLEETDMTLMNWWVYFPTSRMIADFFTKSLTACWKHWALVLNCPTNVIKKSEMSKVAKAVCPLCI